MNTPNCQSCCAVRRTRRTRRGLRPNSVRANRLAGLSILPLWQLATLVFSLALGIALPGLAFAQQLAGVITDALGRPLINVRVELRNGSGGTIARTASDQAGRFKIASAAPGVYSLVG